MRLVAGTVAAVDHLMTRSAAVMSETSGSVMDPPSSSFAWSAPQAGRPLLPEPNFDLAWQRDETVFVAVVKSTTASNEEEQLRLGLGQVLATGNGWRHLDTAGC